MLQQEPLELRPGHDEASQLGLGYDVGAGNVAAQHGDLAEELAAAEPPLASVQRDGRGSVEDHVEGAPGDAFAQHPRSGLEDLLVVPVSEGFELGMRQVGEERQPRE